MQEKLNQMSNRQKNERRNREIDREIDENLKRAFSAVADEPLPDRFTSLLDQLRASEKGSGSGSGGAND